ncbi:MAG: hypothetical protein IRY99_22440 [Isosphaeraceae bacterium]|nr:hypothetical protein [Isosphaeraceae bacterium]
MADNEVRGYAWLIRPDLRHTPFHTARRPEYVWPIATGEPGVQNTYGPAAFVTITDTPEPPDVDPGWAVEPARLDTDFDAPGARLIRVEGRAPSPRGEVWRCVFEVAGP